MGRLHAPWLPASASCRPSSAISPPDAFVGLVGLAVIPVAAGLAILKYRLYEIDRIVNRTRRLRRRHRAPRRPLLRHRHRAPAGLQRLHPRQRPRDRRLDARGRRALPSRPPPHPGVRRPALLPPPLRRRSRRSPRSAPACATRSTSTSSAPTSAPSSTRRCSPPTSRSGCGRRGEVSPRRTRRLAWTSWALVLAMELASGGRMAGLVASLAMASTASRRSWSPRLTFMTFASVGALVASRRSGNPIGWLFLAVRLCLMLANLAGRVHGACERSCAPRRDAAVDLGTRWRVARRAVPAHRPVSALP